MQRVLAPLASIFVLTAAARAQLAFTIEAIQAPGYAYRHASDVNDRGEVAGFTADAASGSPAQNASAFRWFAGTTIDLPSPVWAMNLPYRVATAITPAGEVAGYLRHQSGNPQAAVRWTGTLATSLGGPGTIQYPLDVNASGTVVGSSWGPQTHAWMWTSSGASTALPEPAGGVKSRATAIRDDGTIVGWYATHTSAWGMCSWTPQGQVSVVVPIGAVSVLAEACAPDGTIYGARLLTFAGGEREPIAVAGGVVGVLPTFGGGQGAAYDVNDAGWVVGAATDASQESKATLWIASNAIDLETLLIGGAGWNLEVANAVSPGGLICGDGTLNGVSTPFLLRPVSPSCAGTSYCTAGTSSHGCVATMSSSGFASASASSGFVLSASNVEGQRSALVFYGLSGRLASPWGGSSSYLCVKSPVQRTALASSGGTSGACDGAVALDWNAYMNANPGALGQPRVAGTLVQSQTWYRDPSSAKSTALSDALEFVICP